MYGGCSRATLPAGKPDYHMPAFTCRHTQRVSILGMRTAKFCVIRLAIESSADTDVQRISGSLRNLTCRFRFTRQRCRWETKWASEMFTSIVLQITHDAAHYLYFIESLSKVVPMR